MSTAEYTANRIYNSFRLQELPDDVRRHLAILCIGTQSTDSETDIASAVALSQEEKTARAQKAFHEAKAGKTYSTEEISEYIDDKYPWLCK